MKAPLIFSEFDICLSMSGPPNNPGTLAPYTLMEADGENQQGWFAGVFAPLEAGAERWPRDLHSVTLAFYGNRAAVLLT